MVLCMFRIVSSSSKMALFDKYFIPHAIPVFHPISDLAYIV